MNNQKISLLNSVAIRLQECIKDLKEAAKDSEEIPETLLQDWHLSIADVIIDIDYLINNNNIK